MALSHGSWGLPFRKGGLEAREGTLSQFHLAENFNNEAKIECYERVEGYRTWL